MTPASKDPNALSQSRAAQLLAADDLTAAVDAARSELAALEGADAADSRWDGLRASALETLGTAMFKLGQSAEAEDSLRQAIALAETALPVADVARIRMTLCALMEDAGREEEAMSIYEAAADAFDAAEPPDPLAAARLRNNLAMGYKRAEKFALAEQHYLRALEVMENTLGKEDEEVASLYNNIGSLYYSAGFAQQAGETFAEALELRKRLLGPEHADVAQSLINLGSTQYELGQDEQALQNYAEAVSILEKLLPDKARSYMAATDDYIALLGALRKDDAAAAQQKRRDAKLADFPELAAE